MTATAAVVHGGRKGDGPELRMVVADLTLTSTYVTGGEPLSAADYGLDVIFAVVGTSKGYPVVYDPATKKLLFFTSNGAAPAALAEETNGTNHTAGGPFRVLVIGAVD